MLLWRTWANQRTGVDCICEGWAGETNKVSSTIHISIKKKKKNLSSVLKTTTEQSTTRRRHNQSYQDKPQGYSLRLPACYFLLWCIRIYSRLFQETEWEVNRQNMWQMARVWAYLICEKKITERFKDAGWVLTSGSSTYRHTHTVMESGPVMCEMVAPTRCDNRSDLMA